MIDEGMSESWPEEVKAALVGFELGSLIERPPIVFARDAEYRIWEPSGGFNEAAAVVDVPEDDRPEFGIVTSQTCDVNEEGEHPLQPWVQVSPVYELDDDSAANAAHVYYLHELNGPDLPQGRWYADLRLEIPLEKSALVGRTPIAGFATERDAVLFAEHLGRKRDRAAMASRVNAVLDQTLRKKINNNKNAARRHFENVRSVYLEVSEGTRTEPEAVGIHVISRSGGLEDEAKEWFEAWWDKAAEAGEKSEPSLAVQPIVFHDGSAMDLEIYEELIPMERRPSP